MRANGYSLTFFFCIFASGIIFEVNSSNNRLLVKNVKLHAKPEVEDAQPKRKETNGAKPGRKETNGAKPERKEAQYAQPERKEANGAKETKTGKDKSAIQPEVDGKR